MAHSKSDKQTRTISVDDLKKGSNHYQRVITPYYRNEAALTIQSAFKHWSKIKQARKEAQKFSQDEKTKFAIAARRHYWQAKSEHIRAMRQLKEPKLIDEEFYRALLDAISKNEYHRINYTHTDFTEYLFSALRQSHITMIQMMTAKLMYESLICFNKGKMPNAPQQMLQKFAIGDPTGPYQPSREINYWGLAESTQLQQELQAADATKYHYYTINLPRHQAIGILYFGIERNIKSDQFIKILNAYIDTLNLSPSEKQHALQGLKTYAQYEESPDILESKQKLLQLILKHEPLLTNILYAEYDSFNKAQNLGLTFEEFTHELVSAQFMANLYSVDCQVPMFCIPPKNESLSPEQQPLLSFVLPTMDTFNLLQKIAHGEEATIPVAVIGPETPKMIRAYDEIPTLKEKTKAQTLLHSLYPTAAELDAPARPIELTYPDIEKTREPHGADCYDFLLSWHDIFHAWRNGSNYKTFIRQLRTLHDEKLGFAPVQDAMSQNLWTLSDVDFSAGDIYRGTDDKSRAAITAFLSILKRSGFSSDTSEDDDYLFVYSLCQSPDYWGKPFGIDPQDIDESKVTDWQCAQFSQLKMQIQSMKEYMRLHPQATVVEVILHDLLKGEDKGLFKLLDKIDFKNIFYWSKNTGLYFKKEYRDALKQLDVNPRLRANSAELIHAALKQIVLEHNPSILLKEQLSAAKDAVPIASEIQAIERPSP